ncbi:DsbA family protein [Bordetella pseudohinzii]|uniref:DSBA-like thioredoxin domain n=1 Tax=Bordetella pseudohinzii TaxID=1331258 RepID=A0A0J6BSA9_9BORD|nr:DsbA family protein [Bordetella pseudohinzii]ANY16944.1 protein-disulfide isomerase [Bordetella pseudohinzii]KMM24694.1 protein-disulfide isomerase [Bordetella pseudohinzii]KXA75841.1 protein-disulfide isomerase [Bordetella pseudohinzii]KXA77501.1 protein-disulfide isomerase [Bordetella pseudohinzii]CUJ07559.1 DSBA-like thioredoxin domain [Bordetella pseudohinzii]
MSAPVLHYIYDPLCGWCYGASPLVDAARAIEGLRIEPHGGGMMMGGNRRPVSEALRNYVMPHDERIAAMTGQVFGPDYFDGLLRDTTAVFDSAPPTTAVLAAAELGGQDAALDMLKRIQTAHYVQGKRVADLEVLAALASEIGLAAGEFTIRWEQLTGAALHAHIADSRALLERLGGTGFPTFALQTVHGYTVLEPGRYLGRPAEWQHMLRTRIAAAQP